MGVQIIPSILTSDENELKKMATAFESLVDLIQIDIADGIFVPNTTIGPEQVEALDTTLDFQIHLMVSKPENHVCRWLQTPASNFIVHVESTDKMDNIFKMFEDVEASLALTLNPKTPVEKIVPYLDLVDYIQFMAVEPGFYGSKFDESVLEKIKEFHFLYPDVVIQVDGGVNDKTITQLKETGATRFVVGSYIMKSENPKEAIEKLTGLAR
ncbi:MAG: ribulose-phosphate 3-epimerase [Parcubacteria group bacterium Licking1014_17]|nr:MAG: ribulose-phosphate 3-epimerase [Parcubacteria group bacterium Licking1014_17]